MSAIPALLWTLISATPICYPCTPHASVRAPERDYDLRVWTTDDGMPQSSATVITQAEDGYLWIGTFGGLVKFDGHQFEVFSPRALSSSLDDSVVRMTRDARDRIWIATMRGLAVVDRGVLRAVSAPTFADPPESIVGDAEGRLLISTHDRRILRLDGGELTVLPTPGESTDEKNDAITMARAANGSIYSERGRVLFRLEGNDFRSVAETPDDIMGIAARRGGGVWVATAHKIFSFDGRALAEAFERPDGLALDYLTLFETPSGDVWTASHTVGATRHRRGAPPWTLQTTNGLPHNAVRFVFEGREGNLWIGTDGGGLVRLSPSAFRTYSEEDGLSQNIVRTVREDPRGGYWVGTHGAGLVHFDGRRFEHQPGLSTGWVWSVLPARDGSVWVGYLQDGIKHLVNGTVIDVPTGDYSELTARAMVEGPRGEILVGTERGLFVASDSGLTPVGATAARTMNVRSLLTVDGRTLVGTDRDGLFAWDGERLEHWVEPPPEHKFGVRFVRKDHEGRVWIGTGVGSIARLEALELFPVNTSNGLPNHHYTDLADDGNGFLWLTSDRGVVVLEKKELIQASNEGTAVHPMELGLRDGLRSLEINEVQDVQTERGTELMLSTLKGLSVTNPLNLQRRTEVPEVHFRTVSYDTPVEGTAEMYRRRTIRLDQEQGFEEVPPGAEAVEIEFSTPAFTKPELVRFSYRLEGPDGAVTRETSNRTLQFHHLTPGDYELFVRARNFHGVWGDSSASLKFTAVPYWWKKKWLAPTIGSLLFIALAGLAGSRLLRRLRQTEEKLEHHRERADAIQERERIERAHREAQRLESLGLLAGGIAHDFNNLLGGVLANASFIKDQLATEDEELQGAVSDVVAAAERAAELCRQMLAYSGRGHFKTEPADLSELVASTLRLVRGSVPPHVRLHMELADDLPPAIVDVPQISQVVMNLVINAVQAIATHPGTVVVRTALETLDADALEALIPSGARTPGLFVSLTVEDDGPGIDEATRTKIFEPFFSTKERGQGLGLASVLGIARGHYGGLSVVSAPGAGSTFRLVIPAAPDAVRSPPPSVDPTTLEAKGAVLIIDDEPTVRTALGRILRRSEAEVLEAENGHQGVALYRSRQAEITAVFLDLTMPGMSGEEVFLALRNLEPSLPIVFMSGFDSTETIPRLSRHGTVRFLQKPFDAAAVSHALEEARTSTPEDRPGLP